VRERERVREKNIQAVNQRKEDADVIRSTSVAHVPCDHVEGDVTRMRKKK
jgi:hypothetical protein